MVPIGPIWSPVVWLINWIKDQWAAAQDGFWSQIVIPDVPSWVQDLVTWIGTVMDNAAKLGNWIPWPVAAIVAGSVVVCLIAAVVIQVARIVASFVSLGGGAT